VGLRPAKNAVGILQYVKNMPFGTTREMNCPKTISSLPQKFRSVQWNFSRECGQKIAHFFLETECTLWFSCQAAF